MLEESIYIGHVAKTHGLDGSFTIKIEGSEDFCKSCLKIKKIYTKNKEIFNIKKSVLNSIVFLKINTLEIQNREDAKSLLRQPIYIKKGDNKNIDSIIKKQNELIGFQVIENNNLLGVIQSIDYNRTQPLIKIKVKEETSSIPYVKDFIIEINKETKEFFVQLPDGLIEICKY